MFRFHIAALINCLRANTALDPAKSEKGRPRNHQFARQGVESRA